MNRCNDLGGRQKTTLFMGLERGKEKEEEEAKKGKEKAKTGKGKK